MRWQRQNLISQTFAERKVTFKNGGRCSIVNWKTDDTSLKQRMMQEIKNLKTLKGGKKYNKIEFL